MKIYIELTGGIGNQLFQFAKALELEEKYGINSVVLAYRCSYESNILHENNRIDEWFNIGYKIKKYCLTELIHKVSKIIKFNNSKFKTFQENWWFENKHMGEHLNNNIHSLWVRSLFQQRPDDRVLRNIRKIITNNIKYQNNQNEYCALHIRMGDHLNNSNLINLSKYYNNIIKIYEETNLPIKIITNGDKDEVMKLLGKTNKSFEILDNLSDKDSFYKLVNSRYLSICNSTFSLWAAYMSNAHKIYAPNIWFNKEIKTSKQFESLYDNKWKIINDE